MSTQDLSGTMVNVPDCDVVVNYVELRSCCHVHLRNNTLRKDIYSLTPCLHWLWVK